MTEQFLKIPHSVLFVNAKNLTWLEKCIVAYRLSYGDDWFASNKHVAEYFSTTKKTVMQAYERAGKLGILPQEQMLMNDIINQSGSYGNVTGSHLQVSGSHLQVSGSHLQVSGSHLQVTDESPIGERKEAVLPMKTDVLLESILESNIRSVILDQHITSVILPETDDTGMDDVFKEMEINYNKSSIIKSNNIQFIKSEPSLDGNLDIIFSVDSKLRHRTQCHDKLKSHYIYIKSKGWYIGAHEKDYNKAAKNSLSIK